MPSRAEQGSEGLQRAAQPPGGDPHLVHRVRLVPADQRVVVLYRVGLRAQVGEHDLRRGGVPAQPARLRPGRRQLVGERAFQLGRVPGRAEPGLPQPPVRRLEQPGVPAGQLELRFLPAGDRRGPAEGLRRDVVDDHFGQRVPRLVAQNAAAPHRVDVRDRLQRLPPGVRPDQVGQLRRDRGAVGVQRPGELAAGIGAGLQLQVPALVGPPRRRRSVTPARSSRRSLVS